jgi:hypothetical protein
MSSACSLILDGIQTIVNDMTEEAMGKIHYRNQITKIFL